MDKRQLLNKYRVYCATESNYVHTVSLAAPTKCPNDANHTIIDSRTTLLNPSKNTVQMVDVIGETIYGKPHLGLSMGINNSLLIDVQKGAFGSLKVHEDTPQVSCDFLYNISEQLVSITSSNNGSVEHFGNMVMLSTGSNSDAYAKLHTKRVYRYRPGQGGNVMFTAMFTPGVEGSSQIVGLGSDENGYFFGYNGSNFGVCRRCDSVDNWTYQCHWNMDKMDGNGPSGQVLDVTKGNVYKINFQWLGFGSILYYIEESETGTFVPVHRIAYANKNTVTSVVSPTAPIMYEVKNTTNQSNIQIKSPCCVAFSEGKKSCMGVTHTIDNTQEISSSNLTNIVTIRNKDVYLTRSNFMQCLPNCLSVCTDGSQGVVLYVIRNANFDGTQTWADISMTSSTTEYDISNNNITQGEKWASYAFSKLDSRSIPLNGVNLTLDSGDTLTIAGKVVGGGSNNVTVALTWLEDR